MSNKYIIIPEANYKSNELWDTPLLLATSMKEAKKIKKQLNNEELEICASLESLDIHRKVQKYNIYKLVEVAHE